MSQDSLIIPTTGILPGMELVLRVNAALNNLATHASGSADPSTLTDGVQAYSFWIDTSASPAALKMRNPANDGWILVAYVSGTEFTLAGKGQPGGYATLDGSGLVPSEQLPSYVDVIAEYANAAAFPATGAAGVIYFALDVHRSYRWTGSAYLDITEGVDSVNGKNRVVILNASDLGFTPNGTGAVPRTLQAKNRDVLSTNDFDTANHFNSAKAGLSGFNDMNVQADVDNTPVLLGSALSHLRTQKPAAYSFPRLFKTLQEYRTDLAPNINIVGFGSSVGVGATLPDPSTQAPVAHFVSKLKATVDPANIYNFVKFNDSVNGSTVSESLGVLSAAISAGHSPKLCVLAYGMNDAGVAIFNSGQTYPAVYSSIMRFVAAARAVGSDVILMTTPHNKTQGFSYEMPSGIPQVYPTSVSAPVLPEQLIPPASASNITADFLGTGVPITASHRHLRVNQAMRQAATDAGVPLIDVERYWFKAVAKFGEAALFNSGETVHPNLLGHQNSYWLAIDEFLESVGWQTSQEGQEPRLNGLVGINTEAPTAVLDVVPPYPDGTTPPFRVRARVGATGGDGVKAAAVVWQVDPSNGDMVGYAVSTVDSSLTECYRHHAVSGGGVQVTETYGAGGSTTKTTYDTAYNVSGTVTVATLPANSSGTAYINGVQSGIGRKRARVEWVSNGSSVTLGTVESVGASVFTGPTASGLNLQVALAAANTNLTWQIVTNSGF